MSGDQPKIEIKKNGPIKVRNLPSLKKLDGEELEIKKLVILCRCGKSERKPFCDGTHTKISFTDEKNSERVPDKMDNYEGESLTIHDNRGVCSHKGNCTDNAPKVFRMKTEPWIDPDEQDADETAKVIETCPSGALSYTKDGVLHKDLDREPGITIMSKASYYVVGGIEFKDDDGNKPESKEHYTLCRCGQSKNKPFCSGQHWKVEFTDE